MFAIRKKRTIDKIVEQNYIEGFLDAIWEAGPSGLEYASTSGWSRYNPARQVAYDAGYELGTGLLQSHDEKKEGSRTSFRLRPKWQVPGSVYREAYDAVHFVWNGDVK